LERTCWGWIRVRRASDRNKRYNGP